MNNLVDLAIQHIEQFTCIDFIDNTDPDFASLSPSGLISIVEHAS